MPSSSSAADRPLEDREVRAAAPRRCPTRGRDVRHGVDRPTPSFGRGRARPPSSASSASVRRRPSRGPSCGARTPALAVQVDVDAGPRGPPSTPVEPRRPSAPDAEDIDHRRRATRGRRSQRQAADGPDVLLELRGRGASMVQWPLLWTRGASSLTTSAPPAAGTARRSAPDQVEAAASRAAMAHRRPADRVDGRRRDGLDEDPVVVDVRGRPGKAADPAIDGARDDDRELRRERELALERAGRPARPPRALHRRLDARPTARDADLAAAVVPTGRGLEPNGKPSSVGRARAPRRPR